MNTKEEEFKVDITMAVGSMVPGVETLLQCCFLFISQVIQLFSAFEKELLKICDGNSINTKM